MTQTPHAIIAGAGIGGLAAALTLSRAGFDVTVLEQAPLIEEAGAGLQLSPNATGILGPLGVLAELGDTALAPERLRMRDAASGRDITTMPLGETSARRWGAPTLVVHRADLQAALLACVEREASVKIRTGLTVTGFNSHTDGVSVTFRGTTTTESLNANLLVGADGLQSRIRVQLALGVDDRAIYSGRTAWRALVPAQDAPAFSVRPETSLWLGPRAHLVHYPLRGSSLVNIVAITEETLRVEDAEQFWSQQGKPHDVARRFANWHEDARRLIGSATEWRRWPLFDRDPVTKWGEDRVALLGDAAHPMLPFFAQGASQAIEDAQALASAFAPNAHGEMPAISDALALYARKRVRRAARVQIASRRQGLIYHLYGPAARVRNIGMKLLSQQSMMSRFDWLYRYPS